MDLTSPGPFECCKTWNSAPFSISTTIFNNQQSLQQSQALRNVDPELLSISDQKIQLSSGPFQPHSTPTNHPPHLKSFRNGYPKLLSISNQNQRIQDQISPHQSLRTLLRHPLSHFQPRISRYESVYEIPIPISNTRREA